MTNEHDRWRRLVLGLEDLTDAERAPVQAHLEGCDACRRLRERVLAAEAAARAVPPLPDGDDPLAGESPAVRALARASLETLLARRRQAFRSRLERMLPLALAAVIVVAVLVPLRGGRSPVRDLQVGSPLVLRGDESTPAGFPHGVSFRLTRPGYPVVVHVDGAGTARLIFPAPGAEPALVDADQLVLLPPPHAAPAWRIDVVPGCESYLLAVATGAPPTPADLAAVAAGDDAGVRETAVSAARERLAAVLGTVARRDGPGCQ